VAETWLRKHDGRIEQLVVKKVELDEIAPWIAQEDKEKDWPMTVGKLAATLEAALCHWLKMMERCVLSL
jgi:hypothetical protein